MFDRVSNEIKLAMKERNKVKLNALRYIKKLFIENKTSANARPEVDIVIQYVKQLKDSLASFPKDSETYMNTEKEIEVLKDYLPEEMSEDEVKTLIKDIISKQERPQFGMVMKELSPQIKGRYSGKAALDLVKILLG